MLIELMQYIIMRSIHGSFEILSIIVFSLEKNSTSYMYIQAVYLRDIRNS